ncbi:hypothetical protein TRFO_39142 [Tritrichomonas foetus]|uniref:PPM-type phosphatase domain-containing protein n=1 Tax=Tritrichomonas foetus TaxID=1144522 RepID=A0A1J4JBQ0_9EUKA|nr:hypothetical protein TRFO_39142 [Tritrichomonas foetus]|eukprot:OHS94676.1 hypothetical protein TRFO_39142 [Tritrichomonas foetus]
MFSQTKLPPVNMDQFNDNVLTSLDVFSQEITSFPKRKELQKRISRCRLISCQLTKIPDNLTFYSSIQTLELTDNLLVSFQRNTFQYFPRLKTLDLSVNCIVKLDAHLPNSLTTLDLSYNRFFDISSLWDKKLPNLEVLKVCSCGITNLPDNLPPWSNNLKVFNLSNNNISKIPRILKNFTKIEQIQLFGNSIKSLNKENVGDSVPDNLRNLDLSYNDIEKVEDSEDLKVYSINLNCNPLFTFPENALKVCDLRVLTLNRCGLSGKLKFELPKSIISFEASNNQINKISKLFIKSTQNLSILNLEKNEITHLKDCFPEMTRLNVLVLDKNHIESIPKSLLQLKSAEQFSVSCNKLSGDFPPFNMPKIRNLNLSFNNLTSLPDCFNGCTFLVDANFSFNKLNNLPQTIQSARKMMIMNLASNQFRKFPRALLSYPQLRTLILSNNLLNKIPNGVSSFMFLKTLDLSNNHFVNLPKSIENLRSLRTLSLSHNLLEKIDLLPIDLTLLDVSYNKLTSFNLKFHQLQSLNLDFNQISKLDFSDFPNLQFLSISMNPLEKKIPDLLNEMSIKMPQLKISEYITTNKYYNNTVATDYLIESSNKSQTDTSKKPQALPLSKARKFHFLSNHLISFPHDYSVGYSATMGDRPSMEDSVVIHTNEDKDFYIFGIFDGHSGRTSASISSKAIVEEITKIVNKKPKNKIEVLFAQTFVNLNDKLYQQNVKDGCTAAVALVYKKRCYCVSIGDSRIIRVKKCNHENKTCQSFRVTTDYKPLERSEFKRLRNLGLSVTPEGRIERKLAVSRSLGDFWILSDRQKEPNKKLSQENLKSLLKSKPSDCNQTNHKESPEDAQNCENFEEQCKFCLFVSPEVTVFDIENDDIGIIVACDGLWDVITDEQAGIILSQSHTAVDAAVKLKNLAYALGSKDNISVLTVLFQPKPEFSGFSPVNLIEALSEDEDDEDDDFIPPAALHKMSLPPMRANMLA